MAPAQVALVHVACFHTWWTQAFLGTILTPLMGTEHSIHLAPPENPTCGHAVPTSQVWLLLWPL